MNDPPWSLELDGKRLVLTRVGRSLLYTATLDGAPIDIRLRETDRRVHEGGGGDEPYVTQTSGPEAQLWSVVRALRDVACAKVTSGQPIDVACQWGHFRQNRWGHVTLALVGGVLEVEAQIDEQDDSYY